MEKYKGWKNHLKTMQVFFFLFYLGHDKVNISLPMVTGAKDAIRIIIWWLVTINWNTMNS